MTDATPTKHRRLAALDLSGKRLTQVLALTATVAASVEPQGSD